MEYTSDAKTGISVPRANTRKYGRSYLPEKNKSVQAFLITNTERYFFKYVWKITEKCALNSREAEEGGPRSGTPQGKERHVFVRRELLKLPNHEIYIIKVFLMG